MSKHVSDNPATQTNGTETMEHRIETLVDDFSALRTDVNNILRLVGQTKASDVRDLATSSVREVVKAQPFGAIVAAFGIGAMLTAWLLHD